MKRIVAFVALTALTSTARADAEIYVIDQVQTVASFTFSYLGLASQTHTFDKTSGRVMFDPVSKTGSADVSIDATSVNTGVDLLNSQIQSADFFDTARYPVISFRSTSMVLDGERMRMTGDLTIKGITRPVTLAVSDFACQPQPEQQLDACSAKATVTVKRSDFNMGKYAMLAGNRVTLKLSISAVREQPSVMLASRDAMH